jgi:23S rRNA pseudouridine2604 synthase
MSELGLCSRREADTYLEKGLVMVQGQIARLGQKVVADEVDIKVLLPTKCEAVVLYKPRGYVSGQPQGEETPAIRLLTLDNLAPSTTWTGTPPQRQKGYAPAGRLDLDSTGLLIFTTSGVLAKKLVGPTAGIDKEYLVRVQPAQQVTAEERNLGLQSLPKPSLNLRILLKGGALLAGDTRPLKPVVSARWISQGQVLRLVLREGRKQQIRRMMRQLLGYHATDLTRIRIGPVSIQNLSVGQWRSLTQHELDVILAS